MYETNLGVFERPVGTSDADLADVAARLRQADLDKQIRQPLSSLTPEFGILEYTYDLANSLQTFEVSGHALMMRLEGSPPGARLDVLVNGRVAPADLYPGAIVWGRFDRFTLQRSSRSRTTGTVKVLVLQNPDVRFIEPPQGIAGQPLTPVELLGSFSRQHPTNYIAVNADTAPVGADANSFDATGFSQLRVWVDGLVGADTMITAQLNIWVRDQLGNWSCNSDVNAPVVFGDVSPTTARRRRVAIIQISPQSGTVMLVPSSVVGTPGNPTSLGLLVEGIA